MPRPATPALNPILRWLTDAGPGIASPIRVVLLGQLFTSPKVVAMTLLNGLILNSTAILATHQPVFFLFLAADLLLTIMRIQVLRRAAEAKKHGLPTPTGLYATLAMLWCLLQGAVAFTMMRTGDQALQVLSAASTMAILGPIAARNYAAPRLMMLFVCLCDLPMILGGVLSGNAWISVLVLQTPLYLYATLVRRFRGTDQLCSIPELAQIL